MGSTEEKEVRRPSDESTQLPAVEGVATDGRKKGEVVRGKPRLEEDLGERREAQTEEGRSP